jgi:hypothetical protein
MRASHFSAVTALILLATLCGCATEPRQAKLTYDTVPAGAELFEGGKSLGVAPVTRTYQGVGESTQITSPDVTAVWPSGAKTTFFTILPVGSDRQATLTRPADAPGLQIDLDNAEKGAEARARLKQQQLRDEALGSARCKAQQASGGPKVTDECMPSN